MRPIQTIIALGAALLAVPAAAQLPLPPLGLPEIALPGTPLGRVLDDADEALGRVADRLLAVRAARLNQLLRRNRQSIELDLEGAPARRGELLLLDPEPADLAAAQQAGFVLAGHETLGSLGLSLSRVTVPSGMSLAKGEALLRRIAPTAEFAADHLHFQSGGAVLPLTAAAPFTHAGPISTTIGIIDGAPSQPIAEVRGFAKGAPAASDHGSAISSLLEGAGARNLRVADVYGTDPAGGNALAIVRALDWLADTGARVVSISLTGPQNRVLGTAISAAQRKGLVVVAAVGNDGPAAPPAYPASYAGVLAVTAVDGRNRALIEAGRALHLDYAAPGADILARNRAGKWTRVRGTSYAVPLVAARAAAAIERGSAWRAALDGEAEDLGPRGPDERFGRGLLCRTCARRP